MDKDDKIRIELVLSRRQLRAALGVLLIGIAAVAGAETLTMVANYPSPLGIYRSIVATGNAMLARDGGAVSIGAAPTAGVKLSVVGGVSFADGTQAAGRVLTSDAAGRATWQDCTFAP